MNLANKYIFLAMVIIFLLITYPKSFADIESVPHPFMNDENHTFCSECHAQDPNTIVSYEDVRLTRGATATCSRGEGGFGGTNCHSNESLGISHPVDIETPEEMKIPDDFHLDEKLQVSCITCHDPHGSWSSPIPMVPRETKISGTGEYRSYFLRRTNVRSAICYECHQNK